MLAGDQIARYARHVLLPDVGGIGQAALLAACADVDLRDPAGAIAATFLAAGGVGALVVRGATEAQRTTIAARGPDTRFVDGGGAPVELPARPAWWPGATGDDAALAWWRGSTAATRWMAAVIARGRSPAIAISDVLRAQIYAHARAEFPAECCGYLAGADGGVARAIACRNAQAGAPDAYAIDGRELFELVRSFATAEPARVVYHSHPNGRAYLSATDRALARTSDGPLYPVQQLVVGVTAERVVECAQFAWDAIANDFVEVARWDGAPRSVRGGEPPSEARSHK